MKIIVDQLPQFAEDCLYFRDNGNTSYCRITERPCAFTNGDECTCLMAVDQFGTIDRLRGEYLCIIRRLEKLD